MPLAFLPIGDAEGRLTPGALGPPWKALAKREGLACVTTCVTGMGAWPSVLGGWRREVPWSLVLDREWHPDCSFSGSQKDSGESYGPVLQAEGEVGVSMVTQPVIGYRCGV